MQNLFSNRNIIFIVYLIQICPLNLWMRDELNNRGAGSALKSDKNWQFLQKFLSYKNVIFPYLDHCGVGGLEDIMPSHTWVIMTKNVLAA